MSKDKVEIKKHIGNVEQVIISLMQDLLGNDVIKPGDNFFHLGGSSLTAIQLNHKLHEIFNVRVPLERFFRKPTPRGICETLFDIERNANKFSTLAQNYLTNKEKFPGAKKESNKPSQAQESNEANNEATFSENLSCVNNWDGLLDSFNDPTIEACGKKKMIDFSIFFFSGSDRMELSKKYDFIIKAAEFADKHDFLAVWCPERHFHEFGGLYPNPAILHSALAMVTKNIKLRAGSVVLPLNNPIRVVENWSVVDNISGGRVGISFAPGFHPNDFCLSPNNYAERRNLLKQSIPLVQELWRGGSISLRNGKGDSVSLQAHPEPVQKELPIWLTASKTKETFVSAGINGHNILTGMMEQSVELLADNIREYKHAYSQHHSGKGHVTLMVHTFIGADDDAVKNTVRGPFCDYLRSHMKFSKPFASSAKKKMVDENQEELVEFSFNRYFSQASLFGTTKSCKPMIQKLIDAGVDEIACLIDFGIPQAEVLKGLNYLNELKNEANKCLENKFQEEALGVEA